MSFEINKKDDLIKFLDRCSSTKNLMIKGKSGKLAFIAKESFQNMSPIEKEETLKNLEQVIERTSSLNQNEYAKALNKIRQLRNDFFISLNSGEEAKITNLPTDILREKILGATSPRDVEQARLVSKEFKNTATPHAQVLSINEGKLRLKFALPPKFKTTDKAIEWLLKTNKAAELTHANLLGFSDLNESHLETLFKICPNLHQLTIKSNKIEKLPFLPKTLKELNCSECSNLKELPALSHLLEKLNCSECYELEELPFLPETLKELNCSECSNLKELPALPHSLEKLNCSGCSNLQNLPILYQSLKVLECSYCFRLQNLPDLPESLEKLICSHLKNLPTLPQSLRELNCNKCVDLEELPTLPQSLKELNCNQCLKLKKLPTLPELLEKLWLHECSNLNELPILPQSLKALFCSNCCELKELGTLPKLLERLHCADCSKLERLSALPETLQDLNCSNCPKLKKLPRIPQGTFVTK